jgi:hypothetical protein
LPMMPGVTVMPGMPEQAARNGPTTTPATPVTSLFAALDMATTHWNSPSGGTWPPAR